MLSRSNALLSSNYLYLFALYVSASRIASANLVNRTIDDHYGDSVTGIQPIYNGKWNYGPTCGDCSARLDQAKTFMSSWHDTTASPDNNISVAFNFTGVCFAACIHRTLVIYCERKGIAIWVYCIVPNEVPNLVTFVNISIELDGKPAGKFQHSAQQATDSEPYGYNVTIYSHSELENTQHTLIMSAMPDEGQSLFLFDWAEYT